MRDRRMLGLTRFAAVPVLLACVGAARCATGIASLTTASSPSPLPLDAFGGTHVAGGVCKAAPYHQFDFWLGTWDAYTPKGTLGGTNHVKSKLGGCVVEENWTGANLGRGRSLNFFDASTSSWSQMWVSSGGCPSGVILVEGELSGGSLTMRGRREQPDGVMLGPPCAAAPPKRAVALTNLIRWTVLPSGSVLQQAALVPNDDTLPELPPPAPNAGLRYDRVATMTALSSPDPSYCPSQAQATQFDFMVGSWQVRDVESDGPLGVATFVKDLQGCLVDEHFAGTDGYEGMSFNTFDPFTHRWLRTYVDTDGQRVLLTGGLERDAMVLSGVKRVSGRPLSVRSTWAPAGSGTVRQRWEISRDGGSTWTVVKELTYARTSGSESS